MATIDQVIDIIPDAGHRGVDARTLFVTKQEAFQDAITDAFVPQLNTFKTEANLLASEVNTLRDGTLALRNETENIRNLASTQTQAQVALATTQAGIAMTKASEANTSANQALTYKNQIQGYVIPAGTSYSADQLNTKYSAMTKAQFNALAEERKANRAGSGFDNFGSNYTGVNNIYNVNQGLNTLNVTDNMPNSLLFSVEDMTSSKTPDGYPLALISGVRQKLKSIGANYNKIQLPTAPNIYPHNTVLTAEQIASGVIKHADASNSGLITLGKNLSGTTFNQTVVVVNGKKYIIEYKDNGVRKTLEVTASSTSYTVSLSGINITEVGMYPLDAISSSDLVFLESWHEDISEKNFVYPLGNVQYLGANTDGLTGIANGAFTGFETYSLFGFVN